MYTDVDPTNINLKVPIPSAISSSKHWIKTQQKSIDGIICIIINIVCYCRYTRWDVKRVERRTEHFQYPDTNEFYVLLFYVLKKN